jgi:Fe-S cluster assembly scaffold protein SufB
VVARKWYQRYSGAYGSPINLHTSDHLGFAKIQSIRPAGVEPVYDIEVEGYHNFIAEGLIVHNSEAVYHSMREDLQKQGVIFLDMDTGLKEHPEIVKRYFGTVIPPADNKFAALNTATWSGGSFIYVPKGVSVAMPLQAYFRINAKNMGQFERTLIIADEGAQVTYIEGCFTKGALVTTNPDYKPIERVKVGERVLTHTGEYRRVYHTQERPYSGALYTIEVYGDATQRLEVTEEHPFLYVERERRNERNRSWEVRWGTPKNLRHLDYLAVPINRIVESVPSAKVTVTFRRQEEVVELPSTPEFFRLAGYFLAEGSTNARGYLHFSFAADERGLVNDVKRLLRDVLGVKKVDEFPYPRNHGTSLVVSSAKLARAFRQLFGESAGTRRIPQWMMLETAKKQRELILGMFRGDGNYYNRPNKHGRKELFRLSTISPVLARQLRDMLLRLGIVTFLNRRERRREGRRAMFTVGAGGEFAIPFGKLVGVPIKRSLHGRKRATLFAIDGRYAYVPIKRITTRSVRHTPVYNFSVERDESYVAGGVAVHNCTAPSYSSDSLHSAVVELIALPHSRIRYVTIQNWSKNVYNLVTKRGVAHENATIEWLDGNLGCVRGGELVYTERGPKPIETVEPGTRVWSFDELGQKWVLRPVVARKDSGLQQVYGVTFSNGRTVHLTASHPLLSVYHDRSRPMKLGRYSLRWSPLKELSIGRYVVFPTVLATEGTPYPFAQPQLSKTFIGRNQYGASYEVASHGRLPITLPPSVDEDTAWMLGLWLAEGDYYIGKGVNGGPRFGRVGWSVPRADRARRRLARLLDRSVGWNRIDERKDGVYLRVNSLEFALWLQANGFTPGARQKRVPDWVFGLPHTFRLAFIAGYLDGDGCGQKTGLVVKSASRQLLSDIQMLAVQSGIHTGAIHAEETTQDISGTGQSKTYVTNRLALARVGALRPYLSPRLRSRVQVARRPHHYRKPTGMRATRLLPSTAGLTRIVSVRPSVVAPTYDLEIDGTSCFVVNGILVHNSKLTMKFPGVYMMGRGARGEVLSVAFASDGQHQDAGAKMIHAAPDTSSVITSKSISKGAGRTSYRGLVKVHAGAANAKSTVRCDALLLNKESRSDTYPTMEIDEKRVQIGHEATVSKIGDEQLFYAMSRGLTEQEAMNMIVNGFIEPFVKELPLEYSVELNRLVQLEMEGAVG